MDLLSVIRNNDGSGGLCSVEIKAVVFLEYIGGSTPQIKIHTTNEEFYIWGTLKTWTKALQDSGYDFFPVDRNFSIHIRNIKRLDDQYKRAYFEYELGRDSKSCTLAWEKYKAVEKKLKQINQPFVETKASDDSRMISIKIKEALSRS
ncbi:LytTR family transcriptional regulator DNA-binding domain-containing protein [Paenibacillus sepulcri]|uniref:LytTR family transcriptional regulator DNA-binding domain-containing protein n=2 Tax=Paenibacillus sepulcri TaxID=359917 RepID=A0ABS7BZV1_9BACL|nr:LytTR family transcriptional regulator DNA-binding domain-containing protein [Paenibacillus sepulcri]